MRRFVAAGFGLGFIPRRLWGSDMGAGTFGAALGAVVGLAVMPIHWTWGLVAFLAALALSLWAGAPFNRGHEDPQWVCIDEVAGTLVALIGLSGWPWLVALVVARLADMYKVLPGVYRAEALRDGVGITADDVVAGLYGLAVGWALQLWVF